MDKSTKKLLSGSMIYFLGNAMTQLLSLALLRFVTGRISPEEYGIYNLIVTVSNLVTPVLTLQIADAVFKFILASKTEDEKKKYYTVGLCVTIASVFITIVLVYLAEYLFSDIPYCLLVALYIAFTGAYNIYQRIARSVGRNKDFVAGNLIKTTVFLLLEIFLIYAFGLGAQAIFIAVIVSYIVFLIFVESRIHSLRYLDIGSIDLSTVKEILSFSIPLIPNTIFWWLTSSINTIIVSARCGLDINGIYTVANKFSSVLVMVTSVFAMSWQESALSEYGSKDFRSFFTKTFDMYSVGIASALSVLITLMHLIFPLIIDESYYQSIKYAPYLLLASGCSALAGFSAQIFLAKSENKRLLFTNILGMVLNILIVLLLIDQVGLWAAVFGTLIAEISILGSRLIWVRGEFSDKYKASRLILSSFMLIISIILYSYADIRVNAVWLLITLTAFICFNRMLIGNIVSILIEAVKGRKLRE